jgi:alpha-L-rhamnosidase
VYRRADFVWSEKQPIDSGGLMRLFVGGRKPRTERPNRFFLFRRRVVLPGAPDEARLELTVDGRYQLFANGQRVGRGPVRCDPLYQRVDTHELAPHLRAGENVLALLMRVYGIDTAWYQRVRGLWNPVFGDGALYADGFARCGDERVEILSDTHWRCLESSAWTSDTPRVNWGLPQIEVLDGRALAPDWHAPGFDDSAWDGVRVLSIGGGPPDSFFGGMKTEPFPTLLPRGIPFLEESPLAPLRVARWYGVEPKPELAVDKRLYQEPLVALPARLVEEPDALLGADERATLVRTSAANDVAFLLDFGRIHTAYPCVELEARGGERLELAAAEGVPGEWEAGGPKEPMRIDVARSHGSHVSVYTARPGVQRFEAFEWTAVRWLQVTVRNAPEGVRIRHVGAVSTRYPVEHRGAFECSDPFLNELWRIGRTTLELCMHDGWEDCPGREQRQWLGDATVEMLVAQAAFGPSANALNRKFLEQAAESQRPDGLTQMFAPGDHGVDGLLIPDWTLQWILNAELHWLYAGDLDTVERIFPAIERALAWFERQIGPNDLVANLPHWHFMDWSAVGRAGEAATLNAQLVGCLRAAARMARALESARAARKYDALAARIATALSRRHWDERRGVYVDCVDPATGAQDPRVSQHANAALILWDVAPRERWDGMVRYISDPARIKFTAAPPIVPTGEPFDPAHDVVLANTFYSHFVYRGLSKAGRFDAVLRLVRERYGDMLARGATTLWESFAPTASLCHGFSATPVYQLSTELLGVAPLAPGFTRFRFAPQPADLSFARGLFPTASGDVRVDWVRRGDRVELALEVPAGARAELVDPPGFRFTAGEREVGPGKHRLELEPA